MFQHKLGMGLGVLLLGIAVVFAADKGKGLLFPEMTPEKSTFEKPFGKLGDKPAQPWSVTTVAAAVDGKPLPGKVTTISGEVIDYSCYLQLGKHGEKHRDCGQKCLQNGQPMGLLTKDGDLYLLMEEEHNPRRDGMTDLRKACIENMARVMEVTGTYSEVAGTKALFVTGFLKK
jgi:hypothetical protein